MLTTARALLLAVVLWLFVLCVPASAGITWCDSSPFTVDNPPAIPTVSEWGMVTMTLLVFTVGTLVFARRKAPTR